MQTTLIYNLDSGGIAVAPSDDVVHLQPFVHKRAMEFAHLQHFKRLVKEQHPSFMFRLLKDGGDPPDFIISRDGSAVGLELTVLTSEERRQQVEFFSRMQDRFLCLHSQGRLQNLPGLHIEVSFGELGGRPFSVSDDDLLSMVDGIEAINEKPWVTPSNKSTTAPDEELHPLGVGGDIAGGLVTWYVCEVSNAPWTGSSLANATGFEISHSHRANITEDEFREQIEAVVRRKDREDNQELLITVGAPGLNGKAYPGEGTVSAVMLERWDGLRDKPQHLRRVFLDSWTANKVFVIYDRDPPAT